MTQNKSAKETRLQTLKVLVNDAIEKGWPKIMWIPKKDNSHSQVTEYDILLISDYCKKLGLKASRVKMNSTIGEEICFVWGLELTPTKEPIPEEPILDEEGISISVEDYKILKFAQGNPICKTLYRIFAKKD